MLPVLVSGGGLIKASTCIQCMYLRMQCLTRSSSICVKYYENSVALRNFGDIMPRSGRHANILWSELCCRALSIRRYLIYFCFVCTSLLQTRSRSSRSYHVNMSLLQAQHDSVTTHYVRFGALTIGHLVCVAYCP